MALWPKFFEIEQIEGTDTMLGALPQTGLHRAFFFPNQI